MKYDAKNKTLKFSSDAEVSKFHDQLTEMMRAIMSGASNFEADESDPSEFTKKFFARYSVLTDTLVCLRAHLPRGSGVP